jgi:hypothetical protein
VCYILGQEFNIMSPQNFFFKLCALRIADSRRDSTYKSLSLGEYRNLVHQYAEELGIRTEVETADDPMVDALVLLRKQSYIKLDKWDGQLGRLRNFSEYMHPWDFVGGVGRFRLEITEEGRELLAEMESQILAVQPVKSRPIGFHADRAR